MLGTITVEIPDSCQNCRFCKAVMKEPLTIKLASGESETISGAFRCSLDDIGKRIVPLGDGTVMEIQSQPVVWQEYDKTKEEYILRTSVQYNSVKYEGRPDWCPINNKGWR